MEVEVVELSHAGPQQQRQLAFIDKNHDLYITPTRDFAYTGRPVIMGELGACYAPVVMRW